MPATILDGRAFATQLQHELTKRIAAFTHEVGTAPCLTVVQVEGDEPSDRYARGIRRLCEKVGITFVLQRFTADVTQHMLNETIQSLSADESVHGILLQVPLPASLTASDAIRYIDYTKDVDGVHPYNTGLLAQGGNPLTPNTPAGGMALLQHYNITVDGKRAAVVGGSTIVGRPMAAFLLREEATVTMCHSRTHDLGAVLRECEIIAVATGTPHLITADMVRPGCVILDFGINVCDDGSVVGDVDFDAVVEVARAITPVPGGTGPVTNAMLVQNVLIAAQRQRGMPEK